MNKDDLIKKLENLDLPEVEFPSHKRQLKMALLNSGYFKKQTTMSLLKKFAPIGAVAVITLLIVVGVSYFKNPSSVSQNSILLTPVAYAKELVTEAQKQLTRGGIAGFPDPTTGIIQWKTPDADGNIKDAQGRIIFTTTPEGELVPAPREKPSLESTYTPPEVIFDDMTEARNTAYYYVIVKPAALSQEQISALRTAGVRMLQLPSQDEITMLKNIGVGISDEKSVYAALIEEDQVEKIKKLDFVASIVLPRIKVGIDEGGVDLNNVGSSDEVNYTVSKDSFLSFLAEAKKADDLVYLGDKIISDDFAEGSRLIRIRVLRFTDEKGSTAILGIDESNLPVVYLAYTKDGGVIFGSGEINGKTPVGFNLEDQIRYWTENLEQPTDFKAIQK